MDKFAEINAFVRVVDNGSFSAAGRELDMTTSTLSKLISRLEERLGVRLLQRTTRRLHLTAEGDAFYCRAQQVLVAMDEAEAEVVKTGLSPRGLLRLHCGTAFGTHQLAPAVPDFLQRYPNVKLDISITDQLPELSDSCFDLALRIGTMDDSSIIARRICDLERIICAAPDYLERAGTPRTPDDLQGHNCLWITSLPDLRRWPFDTLNGVRIVQVDGSVAANSAETVLQLAIAGAGITRLTDIAVSAALQSGLLVPILVDYHHVEPIPLHVIYPSSRHLAPKVRVMVDFLFERFSSTPWRRPY
jgi:DNA-binding transcriptional LysR family regulator